MTQLARDLMKTSILLASVALAACATGRAPPEVTAMAELRDEATLTYMFGMGDKACTITAPTGMVAQYLGAPEALVKVKPFAIDVHEVTNEQYRYCISMDICSDVYGYDGPNLLSDYFALGSTGDENPKYNAYPVVYVTQRQAQEYCAFVGKRLPTEFEWERVAGGPGKTRDEKRLYTFLAETGPAVKIPLDCGKNVALSACSDGTPQVRPVATMADDVVMVPGYALAGSVTTAVYDLAGNVMEWTASDSDEDVKRISATCDWTGDEPWTPDCDACTACLPTLSASHPCPMCQKCVCGHNQHFDPPNDPTGTVVRPECYVPNNTPICPRYPPGTVLDKHDTGKHRSSRRIIRGGASISPSQNAYGVVKSTVDNCFGRSDARVMAKGPVDPPLAIVGFRCAKDL